MGGESTSRGILVETMAAVLKALKTNYTYHY